MKRETRGELIFWAATICGLALYSLSAPAGLPWNGSTRAALAWAGEIAELPVMPHPVWGYFIQVFGGRFIAVSAVAVALSSGLLGAIANRYLGWRIGAAVSVVWLFLPPIWDCAVTGERIVFWIFGVVLLLWLANAVFLFVTRHARKTSEEEKLSNEKKTLEDMVSRTRRYRINRAAGWTVLGLSALFAVVAAVEHDYTVGEAASAYARTILDEAGDRLVIMGGVADDQMIWEAERRAKGSSGRLLVLRTDEAYRTQLVARVKRDWPGETNLHVAASIGLTSFAELAVQRHPDRVYLMTGRSTTPEKWSARWETMKSSLASSDSFIPVMRRAFAFEANTLANQLQDEGKKKEAWALYWRIVEEIDPENASAFVNLNEMIRRGYPVDDLKRRRVEEGMTKVRKGFADKKMVAVIRSCGPVRPDEQLRAEFRAELERRMAEMKAKGETKKTTMPSALKSLLEWNDEMIRAYDIGDLKTAGRIARTILSRREWRGFIPANAVLGAATASEGDYVASAAFYRTAVTGPEKPPVAVYNDYADTLCRLGEFSEAEKYARLAIVDAPDTNWIVRLTLAEILKARMGNGDVDKEKGRRTTEEIEELLKVVYKYAPEVIRIRTKKAFGVQ